MINNVVKSYTKLKKIDKQEDCFMNASPKNGFLYVGINCRIMVIKYKQYHVEQRLQEILQILLNNKVKFLIVGAMPWVPMDIHEPQVILIFG